MIIASLRPDTAMLHIDWQDGTYADFPYIWLRDNDPAAFHPQTKERVGDLTSFPLDILVDKIEANDKVLTIWWAGDDTVSTFDIEWLRTHSPGQRAADPADTGYTFWRQELGAKGVPHAVADDVLTSDVALKNWLVSTQMFGISIIEGLANSSQAGMDVAQRIGFLRETNFGRTFEVQSKPNPNNLAYTSVALPLHTDLTNQELPPGFQFLHCLANEAEGGGSLFCDGYAIADDLRRSDPEAFDLLSTISIPFRFHDDTTDIRSRKKVINLDEGGQVIEICFNAHIADVLDLE